MSFAEFLEKYALIISLVLAAIIVVLIILFLVLPRLKKAPLPAEVDEEDFFRALGGKENIVSLEIRGSRVTVVLDDSTKLKREQLEKHGVSRVITMDKKIILLIDDRLQSIL